ncbi:MAG: response regulator [Magnetococcales bacterium]|nr:response regulator [Magnetococcales bacterium]
MRELSDLISGSEDRLMQRVLDHAKTHGYTRYTSTLLEAWRLSIEGLSRPLLDLCHRGGPAPEMQADDDFAGEPSAAFGVTEARRHRERGITLGLFLGLFKYYRQAYVDLVLEAGFDPDRTRRYRYFVERFFDRVELGFCSEWASLTEADRLAELQTANRRLTNEKNKYLTIFESLDDPVVFLDAANRIENMNNAALEAFDRTAVSGAMYYGTASCAGLEEALGALLAAAGDGHELEGALETRLGRRLFFVKRHAMLDVSEKYAGQVLILQDMTDARATERALLEAKEVAESASRAKSTFLANMSHEIRTPMNAVIGLIHLALRTELTGKQYDYLSKIQMSAQSLLGIINDILDFSKMEAGRLGMESIPFRLEDVLTHLSNMVGIKARQKELELLFSLPADVPGLLIGDPLRLGQVLTNLANNAVKFTERGEILIDVAVVEADGANARLRFTVRDTGIGLTPGQIGRLFQSFSQADDSTTRKYGGTGLGLAISKRLVEMMGGAIQVDSVPGQGSVFSFTACFGVQQVQESSRRASTPADLRGLRVLVVDDHDHTRQVLGTMLDSFGVTAYAVPSGAEALEELARASAAGPGGSYQLVLMDWKMPGLNGLETARRIRLHPGITPPEAILLVSAFHHEELLEDVEQTDAIDGYLLKPFTPSSLLDAMFNALFRNRADWADHVRPKAETLENIRNLAGVKALVAEDNRINQQVARELLEGLGVGVIMVGTGREAVQAVAEERPDIVFMDIQMPELDGYLATREIRRDGRFKDLPILAMTAHAMAGDREKSLAAGMNDHICKPIDPGELLKALTRWVPPGAGSAAPGTRRTEDRDSPAAEPPPALPAIPGIDLEAGLKQVGGNQRLLRKLLAEFRTDYQDLPAILAAALERRDGPLVRRLAHSLKGVAGNLGALELAATARELETAIGEERYGDCGLRLQTLCSVLEPLLAGLSAMAGEENGTVLEAPPEAVTPARLPEALRILGELLTKMDPEADTVLRDIQSALRHSPHRELAGKIGKQLSEFDFEGAQTALQELAGALGVPAARRD